MALPKKQPERWSSKPPFQVVEDARPKLFPIRSWDLVTRQSDWMVRVAFWLVGTVLAVLQSWSFRHFVTADGIAYLDRGSGATQQLGSGDQLAARTTNDALGVGPLRGDWKSLLRTALHNAKAFHSGREQQL
jgi:hypothetical protein